VGDIHQPLHVADRNHDGGGSGFHVTYRGNSNCAGGAYEPDPDVELHSVWDIRLVVELENGKNPIHFGTTLVSQIVTFNGDGAATGGPT
jgi:hypothetical protein